MNFYNLKAVAQHMRRVAEPVGPMHALWDTIFDIEALAKGDKTLLPPSEVIRIAAEYGKRNNVGATT